MFDKLIYCLTYIFVSLLNVYEWEKIKQMRENRINSFEIKEHMYVSHSIRAAKYGRQKLISSNTLIVYKVLKMMSAADELTLN